jgi:hypothetical protein
VIHYELILLYASGLSPSDVTRTFGYSRGTAYRFHRIYRDAGKRLSAMLTHRNSVTPKREHKPKNLDALRKKKGRPPAEKKPVLIRREDGEYDRVML